jgi:hypothetical protein
MYWIEPAWTRRLFHLPSRAMRLVELHLSPGFVGLSLVVYCVLALIIRWIWYTRRELEPCDVAVVIGCIAGLAVLVLPIFEGTWAMRFQLMTPVPCAILLAFAVSRLTITETTRWLPRCLAVVAALLALAAPFFMQGPVITVAAAEELKKLREQIDHPAETLVVAPHGVEFWAGVMMRTRVKSGSVPENLDSYDRVLILEPKLGSARQRERQPRNRGPGPPPRDNHPGPPPRNNHPGRPPRNRHELTVPANAKMINRGTYFNLFELPVPSNLTARSSVPE